MIRERVPYPLRHRSLPISAVMRAPTVSALTVLMFGLAGAGCDSAEVIRPTPVSVQCETIGYGVIGRVQASTSDGDFDAQCGDVETAGRGVTIAVRPYAGGQATAPSVVLTLVGTSTGTYTISNGDDPRATASYGWGGFDAQRPATSGTVEVESNTGGRLQGTFSFITTSGQKVRDGEFSVDL